MTIEFARAYLARGCGISEAEVEERLERLGVTAEHVLAVHAELWAIIDEGGEELEELRAALRGEL